MTWPFAHRILSFKHRIHTHPSRDFVWKLEEWRNFWLKILENFFFLLNFVHQKKRTRIEKPPNEPPRVNNRNLTVIIHIQNGKKISLTIHPWRRVKWEWLWVKSANSQRQQRMWGSAKSPTNRKKLRKNRTHRMKGWYTVFLVWICMRCHFAAASYTFAISFSFLF